MVWIDNIMLSLYVTINYQPKTPTLFKKKMFSDKLDQSFRLHPNSPLAEAQYWHADVGVDLGEEKKWEQTFPLPLI